MRRRVTARQLIAKIYEHGTSGSFAAPSCETWSTENYRWKPSDYSGENGIAIRSRSIIFTIIYPPHQGFFSQHWELIAPYVCKISDELVNPSIPNPHPSAHQTGRDIRCFGRGNGQLRSVCADRIRARPGLRRLDRDRKSTRLNSSHIQKSRMPSSA